MIAESAISVAVGSVAGLAIVIAYRSQNAFIDVPDWVYGVASLFGAAVAVVTRLAVTKLWAAVAQRRSAGANVRKPSKRRSKHSRSGG